MGYSDFTSTNVSSGDINVASGINIGSKYIFALLFIGLVIFYFSRKKKRVKSGIGLINFSISPHNEKIAIGLAIVALSMYGLDVYLKHRKTEKDDN